MTSKLDLVLVANSPGELSALVKPVAETVSDHLKEARVILVLTPCQYASGKEEEYIKTIRGIASLITAEEYKNWILLNRKPKVEFSSKGIVLYLGGDLAHALLVAKKLDYAAYAYIWHWIGWSKFYKKYFVPDETTRQKFKKHQGQIQVAGNLMVDSVKNLKKWAPEQNVITFLPGSRDWQINHLTPIYEKIIAEIRKRRPEIIFQLVTSPFKEAIPLAGTRLILFEDAYNSELVITIPGTNTARLAALGIPMLVIFPLDNPDVIPLEGLFHFICKIPFLGSKIKRRLADNMNKRTKFFALPNIKADKEIVKEIRGVINPAEVAEEAIKLLNDKVKRDKISEELKSAIGEPGAALKILEEINEILQKIT